MPKYYCDYCDVFLTHDSQAGRKQHNHGRRHQENVRQFYAQFLAHNVQVPGGTPMSFVEIPETNTAAPAVRFALSSTTLSLPNTHRTHNHNNTQHTRQHTTTHITQHA